MGSDGAAQHDVRELSGHKSLGHPPFVDRCDAGDHVGFFLSPIEGDSSQGGTLGFQASRSISPGHEA